jgi:predicted flap endonuclease-1-like 5' DNA nuclease
VKPWINEDIFKSWTKAQKRLWDSLCSAVPLQPPAGVEAWRETYLKNLATWEAAVRKTLSQESSWVRQWVEQVARENGAPEMMTTWVRQMEEVLQRWVQTQNQWWDEYFAVLRRGGGFMGAERSGAVPAPAVEPVAAAEPVPVAPEPTVAPSEPVAEVPVAPEPTVAPSEPVAEVAEPAKEVVVEASVAPVVETLAETPTTPAVAPDPTQPDDLKLIVGIGPALEKKLHAHGVLSYRQLATLGEAEIDRLETVIKAAGRIRRDDWIGQAKTQHFQKYGEQI